MAFGRAKAAPYNRERTMVASAARVSLNKKGEAEAMRERLGGPNTEWQAESWAYYDAIGEIKYAFGLTSNVMSRIRLVASAVLNVDAPPTNVSDAAGIKGEGQYADDGPLAGLNPIAPDLAIAAQKHMEQLGRGDGIPAMLRAFALNMGVAGECYLVCIEDRWSIRSTEELRVDASGKIILRESVAATTRQQKTLKKDTPIGRIWRAHPRFSADPDSSLKALRGDCEELLLLSRMIRAVTRSRLNAGLLFVPDSLSISARTPGEEETEGDDPFEVELVAGMTTPISDESSAASVVPLLVRGPAEQGDKIKYIELSRASDEHLVNRAERSLERILQGLDVPKDIVTGLANVKYSNAIQIDENLYKAHIEPLVLTFCDAITDIYLRPLLRADGFEDEDVNRVVTWYDPSEVVVRPDRAGDADRGHDKYVLSDEAWRAAHGFGDNDAPTEEEITRRIAIEKTTVPPEIASALLQWLMPEVLKAAQDANRSASPFPPELTQQLADTAAPAPVPPPEVVPTSAAPKQLSAVPAADSVPEEVPA